MMMQSRDRPAVPMWLRRDALVVFVKHSFQIVDFVLVLGAVHAGSSSSVVAWAACASIACRISEIGVPLRFCCSMYSPTGNATAQAAADCCSGASGPFVGTGAAALM